MPVTAADLPDVLALNALVFGPGRFTRTAYRVREGTGEMSRFCLLARLDGRLVASLRFTAITIGGQPGALLLGPLAVDPPLAGQGFGRRLVADGIANARAAGIGLVVLVGDEPYYGRFGFVRVPPGKIRLPGPVDPARVLAAELEPGALANYEGLIEADRN